MTELTLKLKEDILALLDVAKRVKAKQGEEWSDSLVAKLCFNHGEFVLNLRKWEGGNGGPSFQKVLEFERFLVLNIGPVEHAKFLKGIGLKPASEPASGTPVPRKGKVPYAGQPTRHDDW